MDFEKQHIVPQSYLKRFATQNPKSKKYLIGVRDKSARLFLQSIENVGYLKNYYDTKCHDDNKYWEHYFAKEIEPLYGRNLDLIIAKITMSRHQAVVLNDNDKNSLTKMMCFQMLRSPDYIDKTIYDMSNFIYELKEEIIKYNPKLSSKQVQMLKKVNCSEDMCKEEILKIITNSERYKRFAEVLSNKAWLVFFNSISNIRPFITSDKPVVIYNLNLNNRQELGIGRNDTLIYYPLSPSVMIAIFPPKLFCSNLKEESDIVSILTEKEIKFISKINHHQISDCYKQAFLPIDFYNNLIGGTDDA